MDAAPTLSQLALWIALGSLFLSLSARRAEHRPTSARRKTVLAIATLALGLALFALFFGLVTACDRL